MKTGSTSSQLVEQIRIWRHDEMDWCWIPKNLAKRGQIIRGAGHYGEDYQLIENKFGYLVYKIKRSRAK